MPTRRVVTFADMVDRFYAIQRKRLAPRTLKDYDKLLRTYFEGWEQRNLCTLTADELVEKCHCDCQRSPLGAKKVIKLLNQIWRWVAPLIRENGKRVLQDNTVPEVKPNCRMNPPNRNPRIP